MQSTVTEIARDVFRISTFHPGFGIQFNQFLVRDDEPLLFHTGMRKMFAATREAVVAALASEGVAATVLLDQKLRAAASQRLGRSQRELQATLRAFSHVVGTPWRGPEKNAALGAWLALP